MSGADDILETYNRVAEIFAKERDKTLFERPWLDRFLAHVPPPRQILDLGCGSGEPIARYLMDRRVRLTGVEGATKMLEVFKATLPEARAIFADMRQLALPDRYDGILAWNTLFHLSPDAQRAMFPIFAAHAAPRAALMFTSGDAAGEVTGQVAGTEVYHASLDPSEYESLLQETGFEVVNYVPCDPKTREHTIWLARKVAASG